MTRNALMLTAFTAMLSVAARAETVTFHGTMSPESEVPAKVAGGKGSFTGKLDTSTKVLAYTIDYSGLSGPATAAHLHGPAPVGSNAGVLVPFSPPLASPIHGDVTLTDDQVADLMNGTTYANIHTAANPGGELRGQVTK